MQKFEDIKPGARLRGLDPAGIAEVVQIARFGPDALKPAALPPPKKKVSGRISWTFAHFLQ